MIWGICGLTFCTFVFLQWKKKAKHWKKKEKGQISIGNRKGREKNNQEGKSFFFFYLAPGLYACE